jgi:hypothetical protein
MLRSGGWTVRSLIQSSLEGAALLGFTIWDISDVWTVSLPPGATIAGHEVLALHGRKLSVVQGYDAS